MTTASTDRLSDLTEEIKRKRRAGLNVGAFIGTLCAAKNDPIFALATAKARWPTGMPVVISAFEAMVKGAVNPGNTTDSAFGGPLAAATPLGSEFAELIRPLTIAGRLPVRRVPFNTSFVRVASGTTGAWVGQGKPIPFSAASLETVTLGQSKIAAMFAVTAELAKNASPDSISTISADAASSVASFMDNAFLNPDAAAVAGESPASITNGATQIESSGKTGAQIVADAKKAMLAMDAAKIPVSQCTWIMSQNVFVHLATLLTGTTAQPVFPTLTDGGTWIGNLPALVSGAAYGSASATEGIIALVHGPSLAFADDGASDIQISKQATLQLDDAPDDVNTSTVVSMFTTNLIAVRVIRFCNWVRRRDAGVIVVRGINL